MDNTTAQVLGLRRLIAEIDAARRQATQLDAQRKTFNLGLGPLKKLVDPRHLELDSIRARGLSEQLAKVAEAFVKQARSAGRGAFNPASRNAGSPIPGLAGEANNQAKRLAADVRRLADGLHEVVRQIESIRYEDPLVHGGVLAPPILQQLQKIPFWIETTRNFIGWLDKRIAGWTGQK